jgi:hypothetical protein
MMPTRNGDTGAPNSSVYGRNGGGATTGSPGSSPAATSRSAAASRTDRVTANCTLKNRFSSPSAGPIDTRPREVFSPTSPHALAGMRIEPPPSLACATGTNPAATAAAEPPLDPPALRFVSHGLCVGPNDTGSVVAVSPSSGVFVRPSTTNPASR